jgi:D-lactate dehydrogenase
MKAVAYSIKPFEKEFLAKANQKKHDITLISNPLNIETAAYAEGKDAIIVFTNDDVSATVIEKLAKMGIKYIVTRSVGTDHIDKEAAAKHSIKLSNVASYSPRVNLTRDALQEIANQTINNLDMWQKNKCVGKSCKCAKGCRAVPLK